jgi:histidyl-tRNA synthetase
VQLNHRALLTAMLDAAGIETARHGDALIAIDKLDKIGRDGVTKDLRRGGSTTASRATCLDAFEDVAAFDRVLAAS